jgi:hypothetical protein
MNKVANSVIPIHPIPSSGQININGTDNMKSILVYDITENLIFSEAGLSTNRLNYNWNH